MLKEIVVEAQVRSEMGKNACRRLRGQGRIPAVLYGGGSKNESLSVDPREIEAILHSEAGENTLFGMKVDGKAHKGRYILKDHQVDPVTDGLVHVDFMQIAMDKAIRVHVAIHTVGVAKGVKLQGGILDHPLREIELECLPGDIPERIDVDISELELGKSIRVGELSLPEKVKLLTDVAMPVVTVAAPTVEKVEEEAAAPVEEGEAPTEPELIRKGKETEESEGEDEKGGKPEKK